jgi:hypothetical protein
VNLQDEFEDRLEDLRQERYRALGSYSPRCSRPDCAETDPFALTGAAPNIVCHEHLADQEGQSWTQEHHISGQANSPEKVPIPANDHGWISAIQSLWPRETLRNPDASPLLRAAAAVHGVLAVLRWAIDRAAGWVPGELESIDRELERRHGSRWWETEEGPS